MFRMREDAKAWPDLWKMMGMRLLLTSIFMILVIASTAQHDRTELRTDSGLAILHHFANGQISTKEWTDKNGHWGRSWAYNAQGIELSNRETRRIAGHATVRYSYHPNGAVSTIEVSEAPDGGIQWYRSTSTYDEEGIRTGFTEQGHDNEGHIPRPDLMRIDEQVSPGKVEEVTPTEQRLFSTEVYVVNTSRHACRLEIVAKQPSPAMQSGKHTMAPGDTLRLGAYTTGEIYQRATQHVELKATRAHTNPRKRSTFRLLREEVTAVEPGSRKYYLFIGR